MKGFISLYDPISCEFGPPPFYYHVSVGTLVLCIDCADAAPRGILEINMHSLVILLCDGI